jgi:O-antigen/teichoic acid export membrane protein
MNSDPSTRTKTIARNSLWTSVDTALGFLASLLISVAVARKLGPENLGYFNFILWLTSVAGQFGIFGMGSATRKYVAEHLGRGDIAAANAIVRTNVRHQFLVAAGLCLSAMALILVAVPPAFRPFSLFGAASLFPPLLMVVYSQALTAAENFRANVQSTVIATVVNVVAVFVLLYLGFGLTAVTSSLFASRTLDLLLRIVQFQRHFPKSGGVVQAPPDDRLKARMNRFYWQSTILLALNVVVWDRSELLILKIYSPISQLAFYSLSFNICNQIMNLPQMLAVSAGASLMVQYGRDSRKTGVLTATTIRYMCLIAFPALLGLAAISTPVIRSLYSTRFLPAAPVLLLLAVMSVPRALMLPAQQQILAFERQSFLLKWGAAMAVFNILLDWLLIRPYGAVGAAWGNGVSQSLASAGIVCYAVSTLDVPVNFRNIGRILASAVFMAVAVFGVVRVLPAIPALCVGIPLGVLVYFASLRLTGAALEEDYYRLSLFLNRVPARWRDPASRMLRTLIVRPSVPAA